MSLNKKYIEQTKRLKLVKKRLENDKIALSEALKSIGLSYNDLIYENSKTRSWKSRKPPSLEEFRTSKKSVPFVSFFAGCGGMDLGLEASGYKHVAAFEINELFCKTLRRNHPHWKIFGPPVHSGDVSKFKEIAETLSELVTPPYEGLFVGGPPCQPFSIAANQRFAKHGDNFKRTGFSHEGEGNLLFNFIKLIREFKPQAFLIENVPGLHDLDDGKQLKKAFRILKSCGYQMEEPFILNAANFQVPQHRMRLFIAGSRTSRSFKQPTPSDRIFGAGSVLSRISNNLPNHETREHRVGSIIRYAKLNYGKRDSLGRVDRLDPMLPSKTIIAGGNHGGGRSHLHPEIPRTLSVRECARLQTFPDDYVFVGPIARQFTQVGNAVPPVLAAQLGLSIRKSFF